MCRNHSYVIVTHDQIVSCAYPVIELTDPPLVVGGAPSFYDHPGKLLYRHYDNRI